MPDSKLPDPKHPAPALPEPGAKHVVEVVEHMIQGFVRDNPELVRELEKAIESAAQPYIDHLVDQIKNPWERQLVRAAIKEGRRYFRLDASDGVDPTTDSRPPATILYNPEVVTIPEELQVKLHASRVRFDTRLALQAWRAGEWGHMPMTPLNGRETVAADNALVKEMLPHVGTSLARYSANEEHVCRDYTVEFCGIYKAFSWCQAAMVCDTGGGHMYAAVPIVLPHISGEPSITWDVIEPQTDGIVKHLNPQRHYVGEGFAILE